MGHFGALGAREVLRVKHGRGQARQAGRRGRQAGGAGANKKPPAVNRGP